MPGVYAGVGEAAVGTNKTVINLFQPLASPTDRPSLFDIIVGCSATPADGATKFRVQRHTALGTEGSGFTPVPLDPAEVASTLDCGVAHSVEPTYTANAVMLDMSMNQRATVRWTTDPRYGMKIPAVQNAGIGLFSVSSTVSAAHQATLQWEE